MSTSKYYIIRSDYEDESMTLGGMPPLPNDYDDNWIAGMPFTKPPAEPIIVNIDEDEGELIPIFDSLPVASQEFVDALLDVGVDNIVTYDVVLQSRNDNNLTIHGYKAINIIGLIKAASPDTKFLTDSRHIDASIESFQVASDVTKGTYMFRLAESISTIVVHEKVKSHLEANGFKNLRFTPLDGAFIL